MALLFHSAKPAAVVSAVMQFFSSRDRDLAQVRAHRSVQVATHKVCRTCTPPRRLHRLKTRRSRLVCFKERFRRHCRAANYCIRCIGDEFSLVLDGVVETVSRASNGVHLPAECHALTCDVLVQSEDQSSDTTQSDSKFVFKFSTSGRMGQPLF